MATTRTIVVFETRAFNTSAPLPHFINPDCYGDDLLRAVSLLLRKRGVDADEAPGQEDFGWYLGFRMAREAFVLIVGYRPGDGDEVGEWIGELQRASGVVDFVFRGLRGVPAHVAETVDEVIRALPGVSAVWWHHATVFDSDEGQGTPSPAG